MPDDDEVAEPDLAPDFGMGTPSPEEVSTNPELTEQTQPEAPIESIPTFPQSEAGGPMMPAMPNVASEPDPEQAGALKMQARVEGGDDWRDRYNQLRMEQGWGVDLEVYSSVPSINVTSLEVYKASIQWTWRGKDVSGTVVVRSPRSWPTKDDVVIFLRGLFPNTDPLVIE